MHVEVVGEAEELDIPTRGATYCAGSQPYRTYHSSRSRRDRATIPGHDTCCFNTFSFCPAIQAAPTQTQAALAQALVVPQIMPDQLSAEAKHLRDFRKYNPKTFDVSMDNPTKAQMWLTSIETIFWYMKFPDDQKVQCAIFFLEDRGTA